MTITELLDELLQREPQAPLRDEGAYMVMCYNELDSGFGYDCGPQVYDSNLRRAVAKSIARHMNRITPKFVVYSVEPEPDRYW